MKPLLIASLLAVAAPSASAGDVDFHFGFRSGSVRIGVGVRRDGHRREFRRHRHHRHHHHHRRAVCERIWVDGYHETVERRVWVPGYYERVWYPAEYRYHLDECGRRVPVLVRRAGHRRVLVPGRYEVRHDRIWHPGRWETVCRKRHRHRYR